MTVFTQYVRLSIVILIVLVIVIIITSVQSTYTLDYVVEYVTPTPIIQKLSYGSFKASEPWVVLCARGEGVCVSSRACPWSSIIKDTRGDCLAYENHGACCQVTSVRMPVDLFEMYDI